MSSPSAPAIELRGLHKSFTRPGHPSVEAVRGVDLTVDRGQIVAFLGPNGAGKTTTLDMVLGLTEPTSGTALVYGDRPRRAITAGRVSAVLQTGGLLRDLTVRETVRMIASTFPRAADVDDVLERAGLADQRDRMVSKCSGGEQQRLRFALALLPDPELLILDEPTAGMDVAARHDFWAAMRAEADAGRTVVFATHYLEEADSFAERIVMIAQGRVIADGTTAEIRSRATGRTVTASLPPGRVGSVAAALREQEHVAEVSLAGSRITVRTGDSDRVALALLTELGGTELEITTGSLDDAFLAITGDDQLHTGADTEIDTQADTQEGVR
ncbi:ABC transporter ATP-binding protein [Nocardioides sp. BGMRC 2183]|nr:ABC transporter ATP-binding protein [Nocardioides sp. BGMRC 2183]